MTSVFALTIGNMHGDIILYEVQQKLILGLTLRLASYAHEYFDHKHSILHDVHDSYNDFFIL